MMLYCCPLAISSLFASSSSSSSSSAMAIRRFDSFTSKHVRRRRIEESTFSHKNFRKTSSASRWEEMCQIDLTMHVILIAFHHFCCRWIYALLRDSRWRRRRRNYVTHEDGRPCAELPVFRSQCQCNNNPISKFISLNFSSPGEDCMHVHRNCIVYL